ncbi:MAG: hypothetical protein SF051_11520 [Elusimicrobiota bacterium]|nr:hypothetical protein [Elusimicrobiota bacterium]
MSRVLLLLTLLAAAAPASAATPPVASPSDWQLLVQKARAAPTYAQEVNGHRVSVLEVDRAVAGQECPDAGRPGGRRPVNRLFLAEPLPGATVRVYYLRIAALCVGSPDEPDLMLFMLDAEADGLVADWSLWDARTNRIVNGITGSPTPAQLRRLEEYRASLVALFLQP